MKEHTERFDRLGKLCLALLKIKSSKIDREVTLEASFRKNSLKKCIPRQHNKFQITS
jgi:hypothetical protein